MAYEVPGRADRVSDALADLWNKEISATYDALGEHHTRFFALDPATLEQPQVTDTVKWPGDPLEPTFCTDEATVRTLCDWGSRGRHVLQNEYCEYTVVHRLDKKAGRLRPKRVQVTTELREYWLTLATHAPDQLRAAATQVLGEEPSWKELYGVPDPHPLDEQKRRLLFAIAMAGNGGDKGLEAAKVPAQPKSGLNTENAMFMTHPINGLDDLLFIVLYGARRFAVRAADGEFRRAEKADIFTGRRQALACRHADPAAALGAYAQVLDARMVSFANPLGMYLRPFTLELLKIAGETVPEEWVRWDRGEKGMFQRLVFGPGDDDDAFLDDIRVFVGQEQQPLTGGHQLVRQLEVGPLLATGETTPATEDEFSVQPAGGPIECDKTGICTDVEALAREHEQATQPKPEPRVPPGA